MDLRCRDISRIWGIGLGWRSQTCQTFRAGEFVKLIQIRVFSIGWIYPHIIHDYPILSLFTMKFLLNYPQVRACYLGFKSNIPSQPYSHEYEFSWFNWLGIGLNVSFSYIEYRDWDSFYHFNPFYNLARCRYPRLPQL